MGVMNLSAGFDSVGGGGLLVKNETLNSFLLNISRNISLYRFHIKRKQLSKPLHSPHSPGPRTNPLPAVAWRVGCGWGDFAGGEAHRPRGGCAAAHFNL